jgi:hypothetical protein
MPEEAQPRNITRADLVLTEGFCLHFSLDLSIINY